MKVGTCALFILRGGRVPPEMTGVSRASVT